MPEYQACLAGVAPEAGFGGIWESEMFLFYAAVRPFAPGQVLESGRARGKSTLILASCFPKARIVSVELNPGTPVAAAAEAKLRPCFNVELLYGDSRKVMGSRLQNGDAVLIDGPKGFRALKLAFQLLQSKKPCAVFVHDCPPGSAVRVFLERYWPGVFFGDDRSFQRFRVLDEGRDPLEPSRQRGYGIFAILPPAPGVCFGWLRLRLFMAELIAPAESKKSTTPAPES